MGFVENVTGGMMVGFSVLGIVAIGDALSSYIFDGQTLSEKVNAKIGGGRM